MMSGSNGIEYAVEFLDSSRFKTEYVHRSVGHDMKHVQCFPFCTNNHEEQMLDGRPLRIILNILVPHDEVDAFSNEKVLEKVCCIGEFRIFESSPSIYKPLKGGELASFLSTNESGYTDMYWGQMVRSFQPVSMESGMQYKIEFEFNSATKAWICKVDSVKSSPIMSFGVTVFLAGSNIRQEISSITYPDILSVWLPNEVFRPVGYFDSPSFRITDNSGTSQPYNDESVDSHPHKDGDSFESEVAVNSNSANGSNYNDGEILNKSSVLPSVIASAPMFASHEDFALAEWLATMRHRLLHKVDVSSDVSLIDLGFHYEFPAVYKDSTNSFLPLFMYLLDDRNQLPTKDKDTTNAAKNQESLSLYEAMKFYSACAFLKNKSRTPIAVETATLYTMLTSAKDAQLLLKGSSSKDANAVALGTAEGERQQPQRALGQMVTKTNEVNLESSSSPSTSTSVENLGEAAEPLPIPDDSEEVAAMTGNGEVQHLKTRQEGLRSSARLSEKQYSQREAANGQSTTDISPNQLETTAMSLNFLTMVVEHFAEHFAGSMHSSTSPNESSGLNADQQQPEDNSVSRKRRFSPGSISLEEAQDTDSKSAVPKSKVARIDHTPTL